MVTYQKKELQAVKCESSIKMDFGITAMCPAIAVQIKVGSTLLDDFKAFSGFLLQAIHDEYSIDDINAVVGLGESVIIEELDYLRKIGFITDGDTLTANGLEYYNLISSIDEANERDIKAFVELYSGRILPYKPELFVEMADINDEMPNIRKRELKTRVYPYTLRDRSYGDSKDFVFNQCKDLFAGLSARHKESIYTQLAFDKENRGFVRLTLSEVPPVEYTPDQGERNLIKLRRSFLNIRWAVRNPEVDKYRKHLESIKSLSNVGDGIFISSYAKSILEKDSIIGEYNRSDNILFYDNYLQNFVDTAPKSSDTEFDIKLPQKFSNSKTSEKSDYFKQYIDEYILPDIIKCIQCEVEVVTMSIEENCFIQHTPFELFLSDFTDKTDDDGG